MKGTKTKVKKPKSFFSRGSFRIDGKTYHFPHSMLVGVRKLAKKDK